MKNMSLKVLLLENSEATAIALVEQIARVGFNPEYERVASKQGMRHALEAEWDVIICEHSMPDLSSSEVQQQMLQRGIETPLIIVADDVSDEVALASLRSGADDFVLKEQLSRLGVSVTHALQLSQARLDTRDYQQRLRMLFAHQEDLREAERVNIAREVHDELGGMLTAIKLDVSWLQKKCVAKHREAEDMFTLLAAHLDNAINAVRRIITDLRPSVLDDLGLVAAIEWQLSEFEKRYDISCRFDNQAPAVVIDDKHHAVAIFRLFQESLINIARHAGASLVEVRLAIQNNMLHLDITDNGIGISGDNKLNTEQYGIIAMHECVLAIGARLEVGAVDSGGTRVSLSMPFDTRG